MWFRFFSAGIGVIVLASCAGAKQPAPPSIVNTLDRFSFDKLSRVEIAEHLTIQSSSMSAAISQVETGAYGDLIGAHERSASSVTSSADRLQRKIGIGDETASYISVQNSFQHDGWAIEGDRLRHVESGLLCSPSFSLGEHGRTFSLERVVELGEQRNDVSCLYQAADNGDTIAVYASHWPDISLEEHAGAAMAGILDNHVVTAQVEVPVVVLKSDEQSSPLDELINGMERPVAGGFEIGSINGVPYRTSLWLVKTHGWHVKVRAAYPSHDQSTELLSAIQFMASHLSVRAKNLSAPTASDADV